MGHDNIYVSEINWSWGEKMKKEITPITIFFKLFFVCLHSYILCGLQEFANCIFVDKRYFTPYPCLSPP